ncbi:MAG: septum formation protein Maf [Fibrobacteria bacterium]|nr:septum formation protein Maf [Fibrobacteria bacterium]
MFKLKQPIILGSQSPRRREIFNMLGLDYTCISPKYNEPSPHNLHLDDLKIYPQYLAVQKALSISGKFPDKLVISFDTVIHFNGNILGKPQNSSEALTMLSSLNGKTHEVITGLSIAFKGKTIAEAKETTRVTFAQHHPDLLKQYAFSIEPLDKAGSYAIQGKGAFLVKSIQGCYYNVVGMPIQLSLELLKPFFLSVHN